MLDSDSFTSARAKYNADKNRYPDKIPCMSTNFESQKYNIVGALQVKGYLAHAWGGMVNRDPTTSMPAISM